MIDLALKNNRFLCCSIWLIIFLAGSLSFADSDTSTSFPDLFQKQVEVFKTGSLEDRENAFLDIVDYLEDNGIAKSRLASAAYVQLGQMAHKDREYKKAEWAFEKAEKLFNGYRPAADADFLNSFKLGITDAGSGFITRSILYLKDFFSLKKSLIHLGNLSLNLQIAFFILFLTAVMVVFVKHIWLFSHEILSMFPFLLDLRVAFLVQILIFLIIAASPAGLIGVIIFALLIGFLFSEKKFRHVLWTAWLLLLLVFPLTLVHVFAIDVSQNQYLSILEYVKYEGFSQPVVTELNQLLDNTSDPRYTAQNHFMLGLLYKRGGFYKDAAQHYEEYIDRQPGDARGYINLGNIAFIEDHVKTATEYYRKAERYSPSNPIIFYNLSKAYLSQFRFDEARSMQTKASRLDPQMTERFSKNQSSKPVRMMVDESIPSGWIKREIRATFDRSITHYKEFWNPVLVHLSFMDSLFWWGCITVLLILFQILSAKFKLSRYCIKCGNPMKPNSKTGGTEYVCVDCHMIYFQTSSASERATVTAKRKKVFLDLNWTKIMFRIFASVIPGSNRWYQGKVVQGCFLAVPWSVLLASILSKKQYIHLENMVPNTTSFIYTGIIGMILLAVYTVSIILGFREEDI